MLKAIFFVGLALTSASAFAVCDVQVNELKIQFIDSKTKEILDVPMKSLQTQITAGYEAFHLEFRTVKKFADTPVTQTFQYDTASKTYFMPAVKVDAKKCLQAFNLSLNIHIEPEYQADMAQVYRNKHTHIAYIDVNQLKNNYRTAVQVPAAGAPEVIQIPLQRLQKVTAYFQNSSIDFTAKDANGETVFFVTESREDEIRFKPLANAIYASPERKALATMWAACHTEQRLNKDKKLISVQDCAVEHLISIGQ